MFVSKEHHVSSNRISRISNPVRRNKKDNSLPLSMSRSPSKGVNNQRVLPALLHSINRKKSELNENIDNKCERYIPSFERSTAISLERYSYCRRAQSVTNSLKDRDRTLTEKKQHYGLFNDLDKYKLLQRPHLRGGISETRDNLLSNIKHTETVNYPLQRRLNEIQQNKSIQFKQCSKQKSLNQYRLNNISNPNESLECTISTLKKKDTIELDISQKGSPPTSPPGLSTMISNKKMFQLHKQTDCGLPKPKQKTFNVKNLPLNPLSKPSQGLHMQDDATAHSALRSHMSQPFTKLDHCYNVTNCKLNINRQSSPQISSKSNTLSFRAKKTQENNIVINKKSIEKNYETCLSKTPIKDTLIPTLNPLKKKMTQNLNIMSNQSIIHEPVHSHHLVQTNHKIPSRVNDPVYGCNVLSYQQHVNMHDFESNVMAALCVASPIKDSIINDTETTNLKTTQQEDDSIQQVKQHDRVIENNQLIKTDSTIITLNKESFPKGQTSTNILYSVPLKEYKIKSSLASMDHSNGLLDKQKIQRNFSEVLHNGSQKIQTRIIDESDRLINTSETHLNAINQNVCALYERVSVNKIRFPKKSLQEFEIIKDIQSDKIKDSVGDTPTEHTTDSITTVLQTCHPCVFNETHSITETQHDLNKHTINKTKSDNLNMNLNTSDEDDTNKMKITDDLSMTQELIPTTISNTIGKTALLRNSSMTPIKNDEILACNTYTQSSSNILDNDLETKQYSAINLWKLECLEQTNKQISFPIQDEKKNDFFNITSSGNTVEEHNRVKDTSSALDHQEIVTCHYLKFDELPPPPKNVQIKTIQHSILDSMNQPDEEWQSQFDALTRIQCLAKYVPILLDEFILSPVISDIARCIGSLRSAVSKNAILSLDVISRCLPGGLDDYIIHVIPPLLLRAGATGQKFVANAAMRVLESLCSKDNASIKTLYAICAPQGDLKHTSINNKKAILLKMCLEHLLNPEKLKLSKIYSMKPANEEYLKENVKTETNTTIPVGIKKMDTENDMGRHQVLGSYDTCQSSGETLLSDFSQFQWKMPGKQNGSIFEPRVHVSDKCVDNPSVLDTYYLVPYVIQQVAILLEEKLSSTKSIGKEIIHMLHAGFQLQYDSAQFLLAGEFQSTNKTLENQLQNSVSTKIVYNDETTVSFISWLNEAISETKYNQIQRFLKDVENIILTKKCPPKKEKPSSSCKSMREKVAAQRLKQKSETENNLMEVNVVEKIAQSLDNE